MYLNAFMSVCVLCSCVLITGTPPHGSRNQWVTCFLSYLAWLCWLVWVDGPGHNITTALLMSLKLGCFLIWGN